MYRADDLIGKQFGKLTILEEAEPRFSSNGYKRRRWLCQCDCGNTVIVDQANILHGLTRSCGCLRKESTMQRNAERKKENQEKGISSPRKLDLTGQRFGRLTVLEEAKTSSRYRKWRCRCDCGKETVVFQSLLTGGNTKSCGCLRKERCGRRKRTPGSCKRGRPAHDLTGKKFNRLTVICRVDVPDKPGIFWKCRCDCGNTVIVTSKNVSSGKVKSCGCARIGSHGKKGAAKPLPKKKKLDLTGQVIGQWTVLHEAERKNGKRCWLCRCENGEEQIVRQQVLRNYQKKQSGPENKENQ